jgi:hypothetical protein
MVVVLAVVGFGRAIFVAGEPEASRSLKRVCVIAYVAICDVIS